MCFFFSQGQSFLWKKFEKKIKMFFESVLYVCVCLKIGILCIELMKYSFFMDCYFILEMSLVV